MVNVSEEERCQRNLRSYHILRWGGGDRRSLNLGKRFFGAYQVVFSDAVIHVHVCQARGHRWAFSVVSSQGN